MVRLDVGGISVDSGDQMGVEGEGLAWWQVGGYVQVELRGEAERLRKRRYKIDSENQQYQGIVGGHLSR